MKRGDAVSRRSRRLIQVVTAVVALMMVGAGAAWAIGGGLLNPGFEQGSGSNLDDWTVATYDYTGSGLRDEVYGPTTTPVPCDDGDPYGICVVEGEDAFVAHDWEFDEDEQVTVPVLEGDKMVRLGGPYLHSAIRQSLDSMTIGQTFTVDSADPILNLNYNMFSWDEAGYDGIGLRVKLTSPGEVPIVERFRPGSGIGDTLTSTGWQSARLDLSAYKGKSVRLEIEIRGTEDNNYGTWAYVDAGTLPFSASDVDLSVPVPSPSNKPVVVRKFVDEVTGLSHFTVPYSQWIEFLEASEGEECMPYDVSVPFDQSGGTISEVVVEDEYGESVEAVKGPGGAWKASMSCAQPTNLSVTYTVTDGSDSRTLNAALGSLALADPLGVVYDADAFSALIQKGKNVEQARAGSAIAGAKVKLQVDFGDGFEEIPTCCLFPAVNPEVTSDDGVFAWMLGSADFRVVVTHPDYEPAISQVVNGDFPTGLDVAMTPLVRGPRLKPELTSLPPTETTDTSASVGFAADEAERYPVTGFECRIDQGAFAPCVSPAGFSNLVPGAHAFAVRAVNSNGKGPAATAEWLVRTADRPPSIGSLKIKPKKRVVKRGKKAVFKVSFRNAGTVPLKGAKICVKGPKKLVKLPGCGKIASVGAGKTVSRKFKIKVKASAKKGRKAKLKFVVTGNGVAKKSAGAQIRIR